jgi:phosphoribosylformimino-5-aminoimidazole carboxamide ribotide isomerase
VLIVPVIDLMGGQVVHARRGDRSNYRPLESALVASSDPVEVVAALLAAAPFPAIYAADLDAILQRGGHRDALLEIADRFPALTLWVDAGFATAAQLRPWLKSQRTVPVLGSESLASLDDLAQLLAAAPDAILSLDTRGEQPLGPALLFSEPQRWPQRVVVMTLDRVGAGQGPALPRLRATLEQAPGRKIIAAGGVRNSADLEMLEAMGVHAVLIASAIHDGTLDRATLGRFVSATPTP